MHLPLEVFTNSAISHGCRLIALCAWMGPGRSVGVVAAVVHSRIGTPPHSLFLLLLYDDNNNDDVIIIINNNNYKNILLLK